MGAMETMEEMGRKKTDISFNMWKTGSQIRTYYHCWESAKSLEKHIAGTSCQTGTQKE